MSEVVSKIIKIKTPIMPPKVEYIENKIIENNIEPLRWAIIDVKEDLLTLSVSGRNLNNAN